VTKLSHIVYTRHSHSLLSSLPCGSQPVGPRRPERVRGRAEEKLRAARAALGHAAVGLARINSGSADPAAQVGYALNPGRWAAAMAGCVRGGGAGEPPARPAAPPGGLGVGLTSANQVPHWLLHAGLL